MISAAFAEGGMRFRKSRPSDGLLGERAPTDSHHDGDEKLRRFQKRFYLTLAAALLTIGVSIVRHWRDGERWSMSGTGRDRGYSDGRDSVVHSAQRCTRSPLEKKDAAPKYGCQEIEYILSQRLGESDFVGKGYWRHVYRVNYEGQDMALKILNEDQEETRRNKERHRWEAVAMNELKHHPNIVHLLGKCDSDMITEYFPDYLESLLLGVKPDSDSSSASDDSSSEEQALVQLSTRRILEMALDAASGLQAMHEIEGGPIVHTDLQPRQLLLDANGALKINDLNRLRFMGRDELGNPCPFKISKGNGVWRAPEEFHGDDGRLTEKLDIYSMGMIFWTMYGRKPPFRKDSHDVYKQRVTAGERPKVEDSWHKGFVKLFQDMWDGDPLKRPSAGQVVKRLEIMLEDLP